MRRLVVALDCEALDGLAKFFLVSWKCVSTCFVEHDISASVCLRRLWFNYPAGIGMVFNLTLWDQILLFLKGSTKTTLRTC